MTNKEELLKKLNEVLGEDALEVIADAINKSNKDSSKQLQNIGATINEYKSALEDNHKQLVEFLLQVIKVVKDNQIEIPTNFTVDVNNPQKSVEVLNLKDIKIPQPLKNVSIDNVKDFPNYMKEIDALLKLVAVLVKKSESNKALAVDLDRYIDPKRAIAVRLSDGKKFYQAMFSAMTAAGISDANLTSIITGLTNILDALNVIDANTDKNETIRSYDNGTYTYFGFAPPNSDQAAAVWKIFRLDTSGNKLFADGDALYNNVWNNYASLSYS